MIKISLIVPLAFGREIESIENLNKQGKSLIVLKEFGTNPSLNRNNGVKKTKTKYVAFINGHTILNDNWLIEVEKFILKYPEIDVFGGPQLNPENDNFFAKLSGYVLSSIFGAADMSNRYKLNKLNLNANEFQLTSANLICKRSVFTKVKFDENIYPGEDPKFITDAKKAGFKIAYSPNIIVYNKRRDSFFGLVKQIYSYGKMRTKKDSFIALLKHPVFFGPSGFLIYIFILPLLLSFNLWFSLPFILYSFLAIISSFIESIKNNSFFAFFFLPFIFLAIHLSYGAGFLAGLFSRRK